MLNGLAILAAVAAAFFSAICIAVLAGVGLALFGGFFVDEDGNSLVLEIMMFVAGALPYLICGGAAAWIAGGRAYLHASIAGMAYLLFMLAAALFGSPEESWRFTDWLHYVLVIPLSLVGGIIVKLWRHSD